MMNQCDGCRAGKPVDKNGNHRMGEPGKYPDLMGCTKHLYANNKENNNGEDLVLGLGDKLP